MTYSSSRLLASHRPELSHEFSELVVFTFGSGFSELNVYLFRTKEISDLVRMISRMEKNVEPG